MFSGLMTSIENETETKVLDHGFVRFIESWGSDERIIEAARMSTNKGFLGWGGDPCPDCDTAGRLSSMDRLFKTYEHCEEARTSCVCKGSGKTTGDEKLLRFLYENNHATPFEMAGMIIEVQAPIFVFREWHRHRTQCLAPDTQITLVSPRGTVYKRTIEEIYTLKHGGVVDTAPTRHKNGHSKTGTPVTRAARRKDPWRTRVLPNCQSRVMRTFDEETQEYRIGVMQDVWESGTKEIWEVVTTHGVVRASREHPFLTRSGWAKVGEIRNGELIATSGRVAANDRPVPPSLRQGIGVWTTMMRSRLIAPVDTCHVCKGQFRREDLELDHVIPVSQDLRLALNESNLKPACKDCHRQKINHEQPDRRGQCRLGLMWARVLHKPRRVTESMTYDLEMVGPDHNYIANGLVVHNSYNEMSARYTPLPDVNYIPTVERLLTNSKTNKQAGTVKGAEELTAMNAEIFREKLAKIYAEAETLYQESLSFGVPKELARVHLPVGRYSRMRASANLRNWLAFLTLREAPNAQWEIRQFAHAVGDLVKQTFPRTHALYIERAQRAS